MTWTTLGPSGATQPVTLALFAVTALLLVYALGLLYRMTQPERPGRIPLEGLEEDVEDEEP